MVSLKSFVLSHMSNIVDITTAMNQHGKVLMAMPGRWRFKMETWTGPGKEDQIFRREIILHARYVEKKSIVLSSNFPGTDDSLNFAEILHHAGAIPLPPYIKRAAERSDEERYQTIYAHHEGSVAAPTAGLHFTEHVFKKLKIKNIKTDFVTLHVSAGTFKPVKSETIEEHEMHAEFINVSKETIENIFQNLSENIIPVGTTSLRTIESLYWLGVKLAMAMSNDNGHKENQLNWINGNVMNWKR